MSKLKLIAQAQQVGVTTMARLLLHQCLKDPKNQLVLHALRSEGVRVEIAGIIEQAKVPPGDGELEFFVLSMHQLKNIERLVNQAATRMFVEAFREQSVTIDQREGDLYEKLRQLETVQG